MAEMNGTPADLSKPFDPRRELLVILFLVALTDLVIYRGHGFAGYAMLFLIAPVLLFLGASRTHLEKSIWVVGGMLLVLAGRLTWCGSELQVVAGFALVVAWAMALTGLSPYVLDGVVYALQAVPAGCQGLARSIRWVVPRKFQVRSGAPLTILLPFITLFGFGTLFLLANPDLLANFVNHLTRFVNWFSRCSPSLSEILLWIAVAILATGLLHPKSKRSLLSDGTRKGDEMKESSGLPATASLYPALRNMLMAVIGLFALYLAFEFKTLWFRVFPKSFDYSGYAHQGAAWLTMALALATFVLSAALRGDVLREHHTHLRRLAWVWSIENFFLALAVYNRMYIYIGFNGLTWMRTLGLFGISTVVVGFILVVWKIAHQRDFVWLFHRHLWTLFMATYLFAITPVDTLVHLYNVRRILAGDPAPSVNISVHPMSSEGAMVLHPLVHSRDPIIREGIRAMLAERALHLEAIAAERNELGWTTFQLSDRLLLRHLLSTRADWSQYSDRQRRANALTEFHAYAYQWY